MKLFVKVKPGAKENKVEKINGEFKISVKEPAKEERANRAVVKLLAEHFDVPQSSIQIISGLKNKNKVVEIIKKMVK